MSTATTPLRVLLVEDSEDDAALLVRELKKAGFSPTARRVDGDEALAAALETERWDLVLCDYSMPGFDALGALRRVRANGDLPLIVVSGTVGEERAVECMREGAHDFVLKDHLQRLGPAVRRELGEAKVREQLARSERALAASERLRSLGQMAAGVSHDLKNVLVNPLGLNLELLDRALKRGDAARAAEVVGTMRGVLKHGLEALDRLRDFSRQAPERKSELVELDRLVHQAAEIAKARIRPGTGRATTLVEELGGPPAIAGDASEVVSAIVNLIVNAIDALEGGGTITLRTGAGEGEAWIVVRDDGPGMPPEVERRVFEPFFTTKGDDGTGVGLAMVYACMQRHGGAVTLQTAPGAGAEFRLTFPIKID